MSFPSRMEAGEIGWVKNTLGKCWDGDGEDRKFGLGNVALGAFDIPEDMSRGQLGIRIARQWSGLERHL